MGTLNSFLLSAYHLNDRQIESQVPVLENVRDITMSRDGSYALVSYEDAAPPELWRTHIINNSARMALSQTYLPATAIDFAGPSYLGYVSRLQRSLDIEADTTLMLSGVDEQFIICAEKSRFLRHPVWCHC